MKHNNICLRVFILGLGKCIYYANNSSKSNSLSNTYSVVRKICYVTFISSIKKYRRVAICTPISIINEVTKLKCYFLSEVEVIYLKGNKNKQCVKIIKTRF